MGKTFEGTKDSQSVDSIHESEAHPGNVDTLILVTFPESLVAEKSTRAWIVSPSIPPMQQLPFSMTTDPVQGEADIVDVVGSGILMDETGVFMGVGDAEASAVVGGMDATTGCIATGVGAQAARSKMQTQRDVFFIAFSQSTAYEGFTDCRFVYVHLSKNQVYVFYHNLIYSRWDTCLLTFNLASLIHFKPGSGVATPVFLITLSDHFEVSHSEPSTSRL